MRKIILALLLAVCGMTMACKPHDTAKEAEISSVLEQDKIYLFYYDACPYCHKAMDYINTAHPNLAISMINISNPAGYRLFVQCAKKFRLGKTAGTPLFCMGDNYLMGWGGDAPERFDEYVRSFAK